MSLESGVASLGKSPRGGRGRGDHGGYAPEADDHGRPLLELKPGQTGRIRCLLLQGTIRQRLLDLGFTPGTPVHVVRRSPLGDPTAYAVRGTVIALRAREARQLLVSPDPSGE